MRVDITAIEESFPDEPNVQTPAKNGGTLACFKSAHAIRSF
jgi:hypothetical protein